MIRQAEEIVAGFAIAAADFRRRRACRRSASSGCGCCRARTARRGEGSVPIVSPSPIPMRTMTGSERCRHAPAEAMSRRTAARRSSIGASAPVAAEVPEGPAVAGVEPLHQRADAVDRADVVAGAERAVGAHLGLVAGAGVGEDRRRARSGRSRPACRRGRAARRACRARSRARRRGAGTTAAMRARGGGDVVVLALDADEVAAEALGDGAGGAGAEERIEDDVAGLRRGEQDAMEQRLGLLGRVDLPAPRRPSAARCRCRSGRASRSASAARRWPPSAPRS